MTDLHGIREGLVQELVAEAAGIDAALVGDRLLGDDLGLDALDLVELAIRVETMCDVAIVGEMEWLRPSCVVRSIAEAKTS